MAGRTEATGASSKQPECMEINTVGWTLFLLAGLCETACSGRLKSEVTFIK